MIIAFFIIVVLVAAIYYRFIMRNTRIQRELNKSLIVQNELLETVNKEKAKFFSILSHELRTPIYAITGLTSVMNTKKVDSQQIKAIKHSGNYLLFLINNILTFSSFESPTGTTQTKKLPFNLSKVMNNIVDSSMYFASQYNINIKLNMDWQGDYWVKGDAQKLTQVLLNLIVNSIKYSQNNEVEINVFKTDKSSSHSNLTFEVKDNGVGISKEKQKKLFEFEEKDTTGVPPKNPFNLHGMGLGLFVVNKLVSEMDSEIQVESEVNKGTIFSFELTLEKTNPVQTKVHMNNTSQGIFADILVVDDNKTNLLVVKKMLEKLSYTCYTAKDTDDVVSIILNSNIRLVLMDLNMPNINGYELSKRIKEKVNVHIIAHTAVIEEELDVGLLNESGIEGYIIKPYTVDSLKKMLEDTLN